MSKSLQQLLSLKGKTAVVTGGAGYLGTAISETLAELGANLVLASRDQAKCEKKCEEIEETDRRRNPGSRVGTRFVEEGFRARSSSTGP